MPDLVTHDPDNPEFARVLLLRRLRGDEPFEFDLVPTEKETAALARLVGATSLRRMRFRGRLSPEGGGWALDATLGATVVQPCVVTLEPVTTRIDQPVRRRWLPDAEAPKAEVVLGPDDEEEPEPLGDRIDLGRVAAEALSLAVPDYPRRPGAALQAMPEEADAAERPRPFSALAVLRGKPGSEA
jgi:uncharacterized metal-binding protein YceD (DUF177 family)